MMLTIRFSNLAEPAIFLQVGVHFLCMGKL